MNARRRRSDRDQALAARARGLSLRRVTSSARARDERHRHPLIDAFCDQLWLRDGLAPRRSRAIGAISRRGRAWLGARGSALLAATRARRRSAGSPTSSARKAKATSVARRLSALRRFYRLQLERGTRARRSDAARARADASRAACRSSCPRSRSRRCSPRPTSRRTLGLRDRAMLETLYATGLARLASSSASRSAQVSLDVGVVRVIGKGSKERLVPLGDEAVDWIDALPRTRRARSSPAARASRSRLPDRAARAADAAGVLGADQALRAARGHRARRAVAARAAPRVRDAPPQPRRRPARRAAAARPRRHHDDDDLHARRARAPEAAARAASSARVEWAPAAAPSPHPAPSHVRSPSLSSARCARRLNGDAHACGAAA